MNTETSRAQLAEQGVSLLPGAIREGLVRRLRDAIDANRHSARPLSRQVLYTHADTPDGRPPLTALLDVWLNPHGYHGEGCTREVAEAMRPLASSLMGGPVVLLQDVLLVRRSGQTWFDWHQDFGFWPVDEPLGVVFWVPLQPTDALNGALRFAAGSHRLGPCPVIDLHTGQPQDPSATLPFVSDDWPILTPSYDVGDVAAFTPLTFHASPPLESGPERRAWACVFLSANVRWRIANAPNHPYAARVEDGAPITEVLHA